MAKTENKASVQKRGAGKHELSFGGKWQYAKAAESTDHVTIEDRYGLFIGGAWVRPKSGKYFRTVNPATEKQIASVAQANKKDVDLAVQAAQKAQPAWRKLSGDDRARYLFRIARILQERAREVV